MPNSKVHPGRPPEEQDPSARPRKRSGTPRLPVKGKRRRGRRKTTRATWGPTQTEALRQLLADFPDAVAFVTSASPPPIRLSQIYIREEPEWVELHPEDVREMQPLCRQALLQLNGLARETFTPLWVTLRDLPLPESSPGQTIAERRRVRLLEAAVGLTHEVAALCAQIAEAGLANRVKKCPTCEAPLFDLTRPRNTRWHPECAPHKLKKLTEK